MKYRRAYEPWAEDEDQILKNQYNVNSNIESLSNIFQRQPGAIKSRITKLGIEIKSNLGTRVSIISKNKTDSVAGAKDVDVYAKCVVCLAASRKYSGICIAGKELSNLIAISWIRPVSKRQNGELSKKEILYNSGEQPKLLDIINIHIKKHFPHYYQTENYLNNDSINWEKDSVFPMCRLSSLCDDVDSLWINGYHSTEGNNDRIPLEIANEKLTTSLVFICTNTLKIEYKKLRNQKTRLSADFEYRNNKYYLVITDPKAEKIYYKKDFGIYSFEGYPIYMCISIGEPFGGYCYKLVAGIIGI